MKDIEHPDITQARKTGYPHSDRRDTMGDTADLILEGVLCQHCGGLMEDMDEYAPIPGYPRTCEDCQ